MAFQPGTTIAPVEFDGRENGKLLSRQGQRRNAWHNGIDITGDTGTPVRAVASGTVSKIFDRCPSEASRRDCSCQGQASTYGNYVLIKHEDGLYTLYAHLDTVMVGVGQVVYPGLIIGTMGSTTTLPDERCQSMVTHLHFEVVKAWPLAASDRDSRYDVLRELAKGGVNVATDGAIVATAIPTDYNEPRLRIAKGGPLITKMDPIGPDVPNRLTNRWPLYVGLGLGAVALVGLLVALGRRRRRG